MLRWIVRALRFFICITLIMPGAAFSSFGWPSIEDIKQKADLVVLVKKVHKDKSNSLYAHPLFFLKGDARNLVEICVDYDQEGYKPSLAEVGERSILILKENGDCFLGMWGYNADSPVFNRGVYRNCFNADAFYGFSDYEYENLSKLFKDFGFLKIPEEYKTFKFNDCRHLPNEFTSKPRPKRNKNGERNPDVRRLD